ncbi:SpoIID/LytB domain-containing protein [Candidatus Microgenomates bacterium]|nr:SpoIID/LytB domain-containing protein [Candidatus Microgenomates bacterium]
MKKILLFAFLLLSTCYFLLASTSVVRAGELEDVEKKLSDLKHALQLSIAATTPLEQNLSKLEKNLAEIRSKIEIIEKDVAQKEQQVKEGEKLLILAEELLGEKVKKIYKASTQFTASGVLFLLNNNLNNSLKLFGYQKAIISSDRDTIVKLVLYVKDLEQKKKDLENEKSRLAKIKEETDVQAAFLNKEISGAKKYQAAVSTQIASLSARQQEILAQKLASLNLPTSLGAGPLYCTDDRKLDPPFRPAFAFFTFGIPHRVGMNQYGAYGRAKTGQNYKDILQAYFNNISFQKKDPNMKIKVQGYGEKSLEDYVLRIYEMPESWPLEALKAQAVAARSYALAYTNNGASEICTTQACQVFKPDPKSGEWAKAVKETEGEVMVSGSEVVKAWYASTFGGYTFTSGDVWGSDRSWTRRMRDTTGDVSNFSDLFGRAYDRESPCFYAAQGFRSEYAKSAWLKAEELADIVNTLLLAKKDSSTQNHLSQPDKANPDNEETWNPDRVRQELKSRGGNPFNRIGDVSVDWDKGSGKTSSINLSGDGGSASFDGGEFKNFFNLRAPANIQIVGPLYNVEKK